MPIALLIAVNICFIASKVLPQRWAVFACITCIIFMMHTVHADSARQIARHSGYWGVEALMQLFLLVGIYKMISIYRKDRTTAP